MIYPEFGDIDDPLDTPEPDIPGVEMCPTFYGCIWALIAVGMFKDK